MLLSASQLKLFYGEMEIFAGVSVEVGERARIGLVGPNGSGKTSLLRVLTGGLEPDAGSVSMSSGLRVAYVSQMPEHDAPGTLRDEVQSAFQKLFDLEDELANSALEIQRGDGEARRKAETRYAELLEEYEALGGYDYQSGMDRVVEGVGMTSDTLDTPASAASGGERTRAALARALLTDPDLLVLDEPTNYPRLRRSELAGRFPVRLQVRRCGCIPRPLLSRPRLFRNLGDGARKIAAIPGQLLSVQGVEARPGRAAAKGIRAAAGAYSQGRVLHPEI